MKVSVILLIDNVESNLNVCLDSLLNQQLKEIEVIAINEGSTDNSSSILLEYQTHFESLIVINQPYQHHAKACQMGLELATGEYLVFLSSEFYLSPASLKRSYEAATINRLDLLVSLKESWFPFIQTGGVCEGVSFLEDAYRLIPQDFSIWGHFYERKFIMNHQLMFDEDLIKPESWFLIQSLLLAGALQVQRNDLKQQVVAPKDLKPEQKIKSWLEIIQRLESFELSHPRNQNVVQTMIDFLYYLVLYECDLSDLKWIRDQVSAEIRTKAHSNIELLMQVDVPGLFYHRQLYFQQPKGEKDDTC